MESARQIIDEASEQARDEAEALLLARIEEWKSDLYLFSYECLGNNGATDPRLLGNSEPRVAKYTRWLGDQLLEWMQQRKAGTLDSRYKIAILTARECFKTTNATIAASIWLQLHDTDISIVISQAKIKDMADKTLASIKELMQGARVTSLLTETFGEFYNPKRTWNDSAIVSAQRKDTARRDRTIEITSVDTGNVGSHPDFWDFDDPHMKHTATEQGFKVVRDHYHSSIPIVQKNGCVLVVMTRYGNGDLMGCIIDEEIAPATVKALGELPADFSKNWMHYAHHAGWHIYFDTGRDLEDASIANYPSIWSHARMNEYEQIAPQDFASQIMNMPGSRTDSPLKREHIDKLWLEFADVPVNVKNNIYVHMDLAWKSAKNYIEGRGDWNVIQVWGRDNAGLSYYLPFAHRDRGMQEQFRERFLFMLQEVRRWGGNIKLMTFDADTGSIGANGETVMEIFRNWCSQAGMRCPPMLPMNRGGAQRKDDRVMMATRYWIDGTVRLVKHAPFVNILVDEYLGIGVTRHDDMRDAAADHFHIDVIGRSPRVRPEGFAPGGDPLNRPWERYFLHGRDRGPAIVAGGMIENYPFSKKVDRHGY